MKKLLINAGLFFFLITGLFAQEPVRFLYLENEQYDYFDYLINSGRQIPEHVFQQPYDVSFLKPAAGKNAIAGYFQKYWSGYYRSDGVQGFLQFDEKLKYQQGDFRNRYGASGGVHFLSNHLTLANRTGFQQEYKHDPNYAGDLSESKNWIYGRVNEAYMNLRFKPVDIFFGRMKRNWGPVNSTSLVLSDHPYTYDHFLFSYTARHLKLSLLFARLEDLAAYASNDPQHPNDLTYYPHARKFLVGHRLDIRFSSRFQIGLTEMATYGGPERDVEFPFFNPMNFYYGIQRNDRKQMDGNWTLDIFFKPRRKLSLYGQFMIDDVIVNNDPGVNDRGRYPDRWAITGSLRSGDLLFNGLNTDVTYVRVWNRTYQSRWTWENYHYRGLGLGYPCAGCEELKLRLGYWGMFPLFIRNELIYGRYGNIALTDVFPSQKEPFPLPPVIHNIVNRFDLVYFARPELQIKLSVEHFRDARHYLNRLNEGSVYTVMLQIRYLLSGGFKLD